ncbi:MAG: cytochrome C oxidase subunit IV family protein [Gemmatimonadales bacterium]
MAHEPAHSDTAAAPAVGAHLSGEQHHHPGWSTYWKVATILTLITVVEVWAYYIPSFVASRAFVPLLLTMSAIKFATVVMFYMHLKYDHKLFRALFTGPLFVAAVTLIALLFLFGQLAARFGPGR